MLGNSGLSEPGRRLAIPFGKGCSLDNDPDEPLQEEQAAEEQYQGDEETFWTGHTPQFAASDADPTPGDLYRAHHGEDEGCSIRPHGGGPLASHKVGEARSRSAAGTREPSQHPDRARRQTELLMRPEPTRIRRNGGRHGEPRQQKQAPAREQQFAAASQRRPASKSFGNHESRGRGRGDNGSPGAQQDGPSGARGRTIRP